MPSRLAALCPLFAAGLALFACACSSSSSRAGKGSAERQVLVPDEAFDCTPLTEECFVPFPSNLLARKAATETGILLNLRRENFPGGIAEQALSIYPPEVVNGRDGFSAAAPIVASLPADPDTASFPAGLAESVSSGSSVKLVNMKTGEPVPISVKLDSVGLEAAPPRYLLSVMPACPLDAGTTYAAVLTNRIRTASGDPMPAYPAFARIATGLPTGDPALDRLAGLYSPLLGFLEEDLGEERDGIVLAWAFTVRSDRDVTRLMRGVRRLVLARARRDPPSFEITNTNPPIPVMEPTVERALVGTYPSPELRGKEKRIQFEPDDTPVEQGENRIQFVLKLPKNPPGPAPIAIFGHGMGAWKETLLQVTDDLGREGFAVAGIDVAAQGSRVPQDGFMDSYLRFDRLLALRDLLIQTVADEMQLVRLLKGDLARLDVLPADGGDGVPDLDTPHLYYVGQSLGTLIGTTFGALEPEIAAIALNVAGGGFVNILTQSPLFVDEMTPKLVPDWATPAERLFLLVFGQMLLDDVDALAFAPHLRTDPFEGDPSRDVLVQESMGDGLMSNPMTEMLSRALGVPQVTPSIQPVFGLTEAPAPATGAGLTQFGIFRNPTLAHSLLLLMPRPGSQIATFFSTHARGGVGVIESR